MYRALVHECVSPDTIILSITYLKGIEEYYLQRIFHNIRVIEAVCV